MILITLLLFACDPGKSDAPDTSSGADTSVSCDDTEVVTDTDDSADSADSADSGDTGHSGEDTAAEEDPVLDLYILAGQSNADGWGYATGLPPSLAVGQAADLAVWRADGPRV